MADGKARLGRPCTICRLPAAERAALDRALVDGGSDREVAAKVRGISHDAVRRHREAHLPATLAKASDAREVARADTLLSQVRDLHGRALAILNAAEGAGDLRTALGGIREARGCLELLGRLDGELPESNTVNVLVLPQWVELRAALVQALAPFPEARQAAAAVLAHAG